MTDRAIQSAVALRLDLTHRAARGEPATVRVTKHAGNSGAWSAALWPSREPLPRRAVGHLIEAGRLAETYTQGLVTDYELAEPEPQTPQTEEEPTMPDTVRLTAGATLSTKEFAEIIGVKDRQTARNVITSGRVTAEKRDPEKKTSPYEIAVDAKLLAELDARGIAYAVEGEVTEGEMTEAEPEEEPEEEDEEEPEPEAEASEEPVVAISDNAKTDHAPGGDGQDVEAEEIRARIDEEAARFYASDPNPETTKAKTRGFIEALADELEAAREHLADEPSPLRQAGEMVRSAHYQAVRVRELVSNILAAIEHTHRGNGPRVLAELVHLEACELTDELEEADRRLTMLAHREAHDSFTTA